MVRARCTERWKAVYVSVGDPRLLNVCNFAANEICRFTQRAAGASAEGPEAGVRRRMAAKHVFTSAERGRSRRFLSLSPNHDLVEFGQRSFKFVIEEPHRIKNFAEGCRFFCSVSLSKSEDAIVSQIPHDPRVGNFIVGKITRLECGPGRRRDDLDEFEKLHLIDRVRHRFHDRRHLREKIRVCADKGISHGGPVIEPMI